MAAANSNIQITDLDFNNIKSNFKKYLQSQDTLKDYNYEGSALSTLLDILAYNTQYNAYYLNMVANEMFLDTALQRGSVVSHAKLLDYTPRSAIAPTATIDLTIYGISPETSLTIPAYTNFLSEAIDDINYNFVTTDSITTNVSYSTYPGSATFSGISIKQGKPGSMAYTVDSINNPTYTFLIPELGVDTTTLSVTVQQSSSNTSYEVFNLADDFLSLDSTSAVYFLQESATSPGKFEIYFGDGVLGRLLSDGNVVNVSYLITSGSAAAGANNFVLTDSINGYSTHYVNPVTPASQGGSIESIQSIKFQAGKSYSAQGRAVTKEDYITLIQQNNLGINLDAVNVWGGEENDPPAYGQVFICLKPTGSYTLTQNQKNLLVDGVISPISMMTVKPTIVDPDYTYLQVTVNALYDQKKTTYTSSQLQSLITAAIGNYSRQSLNTFNSTFSSSDLVASINNVDPSILANEISVNVQKKFYPVLTSSNSYKLYFGVPLVRNFFSSGVNSTVAFQALNPEDLSTVIDGVYIEEVPASTGGIESISVVNPGYGYQYAPTVTITGDGTGATAEAVINPNGTINSINVTSIGSGYTSAVITITPNGIDTTGQGGFAVPILQGATGTLRTWYNNELGVKTILDTNVGTVDYLNGVVTLTSFTPSDVNNTTGQMIISAKPTTTIISSSQKRIVTLDTNDSSAIVVNLTAKV